MTSCPCGTGLPDVACCLRYLQGEAAPTPEALMRSRYTAYALGNTAYLLATWHPRTRPSRLDLDAALLWRGLRVTSATGGLLDPSGAVTFEAAYDDGGRPGVLHETSHFAREDGRWLYVDGIVS